MSRWVHIFGTLRFTSPVFNKKHRLEFPDEQFKVEPIPDIWPKDNGDGFVSYHRVIEYSLPYCKKFIDHAMSLLPSGESNVINYNAFQNKSDIRSGSSDFDYPQEKQLFQEKLLELYEYEDTTFRTLQKYRNVKLDMVDRATDISLAISDDVRYCDAKKMFDGLNEALDYLETNEISCEDGYLQFKDEYVEDKYMFAVRFRYDEKYRSCVEFLVLDAKTNAVIEWYRRTRIYDKDARNDHTEITRSNNWDSTLTEISDI